MRQQGRRVTERVDPSCSQRPDARPHGVGFLPRVRSQCNSGNNHPPEPPVYDNSSRLLTGNPQPRSRRDRVHPISAAEGAADIRAIQVFAHKTLVSVIYILWGVKYFGAYIVLFFEFCPPTTRSSMARNTPAIGHQVSPPGGPITTACARRVPNHRPGKRPSVATPQEMGARGQSTQARPKRRRA